MVVNPFKDRQISNTERRRVFTEHVNPIELVWHRDRENRTIKVLESNGWEFQFDNELPFIIEAGDSFDIPKNTYHRVIKGKGNLVIDITEY